MTNVLKAFMENGGVVARASKGAAGIDLTLKESVIVSHNKVIMGKTGLYTAIPEGYFGLVVVRSSMGKKGLRMANQVGIIDSDYRGEILLPLTCTTEREYMPLEQGERVAQLLVLPCFMGGIEFVESIESLGETERGEGGFGSTGV